MPQQPSCYLPLLCVLWVGDAPFLGSPQSVFQAGHPTAADRAQATSTSNATQSRPCLACTVAGPSVCPLLAVQISITIGAVSQSDSAIFVLFLFRTSQGLQYEWAVRFVHTLPWVYLVNRAGHLVRIPPHPFPRWVTK